MGYKKAAAAKGVAAAALDKKRIIPGKMGSILAIEPILPDKKLRRVTCQTP